jgi:hypothetical protein
MGTEIGEFGESAFLFEAACNPDPILRLTGVNRALEGLAIDVFNTMKEFGDSAGDPVLHFCEDWMLADEDAVHHRAGAVRGVGVLGGELDAPLLRGVALALDLVALAVGHAAVDGAVLDADPLEPAVPGELLRRHQLLHAETSS